MQMSTDEGPGRRARLTREVMDQTGIDEDMIERLVRTFYASVQRDPLIGPIFATRVTDWEHHIAKLCVFWSSVVLMSGRYHGQPMQKHMNLPVGSTHFDRWLALFEITAMELCPPAAAAHFIDRARRIADSLEMGFATLSRVCPRHGAAQGDHAAGRCRRRGALSCLARRASGHRHEPARRQRRDRAVTARFLNPMPVITTPSERIDLCTGKHRFLFRFI